MKNLDTLIANWLGGEVMDHRDLILRLIEERNILRQALFPRPEMKDTAPLILYFSTNKEREEFIAAVAEAKPNMRSYKI